MAESLRDRVTDLVHAPTQHHDAGLDLTVTEIYTIDAPGRVDFGGDELTQPTTSPHERTYRNPDDDYAWWHLDAGGYLIEYNETLTGNDPVVIQPRHALCSLGAFHPTLAVTELDRLPLWVGSPGVRIKANARVSTLTAHTSPE